MMHGPEKSDPVIVAGKPTNKAERSAAELAEPRTGTKGNADRQSTHWTQSQARVSQALERIRQAVAVTHPRWEPHAGKPHVRICAGGARQLASLPLKRRDFIATLGGAAAWPLAARGQQPAMPVIGFLSPGSPSAGGPLLAGFRQGLNETGYTEGQNLTIEYRWVGQPDRLPAMAADLVERKIDLMMVVTDPATRAAKSISSTIPIVFFIGGDPVAEGLVASLGRPGGNLTGVTLFGTELNPKRLELVSELVPQAKLIGLLVNPSNPSTQGISGTMQEVARAKGVELQLLQATSENEIDAAFTTLAELRAGALIIDTDLFFFGRLKQIRALAARHSVPAMYYRREFVAAGGLISYGPSFLTAYREAGSYAGKILKGAKPVDLPVLQPTQFDLVINLKTAKALGLEIPPSLLARADEVIE